MQATGPGGTCDRIQIRGRILAPDVTGSRSSGEQLGGATLGVVSPGDGENGQIRRRGASRSDLSAFQAPNGPHERVSSGHERAPVASGRRSNWPIGVPSVVFPS